VRPQILQNTAPTVRNAETNITGALMVKTLNTLPYLLRNEKSNGAFI
jgi:hypothetical protein